MLLYDEEPQRRAGVTSWVRRGLELGSKILYTQPPDDPADEGLPALLQGYADALEALARGQIQVVPADSSTYDPGFIETVVDGALTEGYPSVRWSGDASTALGVMSPDEHETLEQATDQLCATRPLSVLCQYPARESRDALGFLSRAHGAGLREQRFQAVPVEGGLAVAGELDATNYELLRILLISATAGAGHDPFVLDLSRVDFLDLPGARALLVGTLDHRSGGGRVRLHAPQPHVAHLVRLLGLDQAEGVDVEETR